jgi:membrane protein insertase Oxa1/YidC/SpoIIIJ
LVFGSAITQYLQSKQLMPTSKDGKSLRQILKDAGTGKKADQGDMQAATGRYTSFLIPIMIFFITLGIASALSLYWFVSGLIAYLQQRIILKEDETELEAVADAPEKKKVIEGEVIAKKPKPKTKKTSAGKNKRRKR